MRRLPALLTTAALATVLASSLTACGSMPGFGGCEPAFSEGDASRLVEASGSVGSRPDVTFPTPLISDGSQQSTIEAGEGEPNAAHTTVDFEAIVLSGETGQVITASDYEADSGVRRDADPTPDANADPAADPDLGQSLNRSLLCSVPGERYALTTSVGDAFGAGAFASIGMDDDATIVIVVDVEATFLGKADGVNQLPQDGMPTVVTAPDGEPGIQVPSNDPPSELRIATIKAGGGATVDEGDSVVLHFRGWSWPSAGDEPGQVLDTWDEVPQNVTAEAGSPMADGWALPDGWAKALVGAKVGSQVLVVMPPADGFDEGKAPASIDPGSTVIVVFDVLGIRK